MAKTIVGLFNTYAEANSVKQQLISNGYDASHIRVVATENDDVDSSYDARSYGETSADPQSNFSRETDVTGTTGAGYSRGYAEEGTAGGRGVGDKIKHFFSSLTGGDDHAHEHYASGVNQGGALLAVTTDDARAEEVASLLRQHGARDIDTGNAATGTNVDAAIGNENVAGTTVIPVVEEELVVGKRAVDRGGVRVYSHVVERPVEADVTLREERVNVQRRFVDRPATAADFANATGDVIELTASGEEAVIGKNSRVVEEIVVGKQSSERIENVHDTLRKTEVDIEQVPGEATATDYATTSTTNKGQTY